MIQSNFCCCCCDPLLTFQSNKMNWLPQTPGSGAAPVCAKKRFMNYFLCSPILCPRQEIASTIMKGLGRGGSASFPPPFHFFALNLKLKVIWGCSIKITITISIGAYGTLKPNRGNFLSRPCISFFVRRTSKKTYHITNNFIWKSQNSNSLNYTYLISSVEWNLKNKGSFDFFT